MRKRRGMSLLEILVAGALVVILLGIYLQVMKAAAEQQRAVEHRQLAMQEAANLMERLCARPWPQLTAAAVGELRLGDEIRQVLPGAELTIDLAQPADDPDAKKIDLQIRWQGQPDRPVRPMRLVAWRYRQEKDSR